MKQLTNIKSIRLSDIQIESLKKLEEYGVDISKFIRIAIKEKIKRDWKSIKEKKEKVAIPF
ncbi:MAG TPA: hypothetical protein PKZ75_13080 [Bacteroidia bacterium]|mgnify:CR=1 FL=1|nr:hypothetical protein [Bacteroidia bacterium]